jgi:hypothetical protein
VSLVCKRVSRPFPVARRLPTGDDEDISTDEGAWVMLAALVAADDAAKKGRGPGYLTHPELQDATGLGVVWTRTLRQKLERWGWARVENRQEGRAGLVVTFVTEHGRRAHEKKQELDAFLRRGREKYGRDSGA